MPHGAPITFDTRNMRKEDRRKVFEFRRAHRIFWETGDKSELIRLGLVPSPEEEELSRISFEPEDIEAEEDYQGELAAAEQKSMRAEKGSVASLWSSLVQHR